MILYLSVDDFVMYIHVESIPETSVIPYVTTLLLKQQKQRKRLIAKKMPSLKEYGKEEKALEEIIFLDFLGEK